MYRASLIAAGVGATMLAAHALKRKKLMKLLGASTLIAGLISYGLTYMFDLLIKILVTALIVAP